MAQDNGYSKFFKAARQAKGQSSPMRGHRVSDVLRHLKAKRRVRKNLPLLPVFSALGLMIGALYTYNNLDLIEKYLSKIEVRALGVVSAEEKKSGKEATSAPAKGETVEKSASHESPETAGKKTGGKDWTSEQLSFFNKLEERKAQLDAREKDLQKLEEELQGQKIALEKRLRELEEIRTKISGRLDEKVKLDQEKVDKLVEFYSNMKPQNAAKVFEDIDEDLAVEILNKMKKKNAADIMNLLKSEKAQKLSEKFAGYKRQ